MFFIFMNSHHSTFFVLCDTGHNALSVLFTIFIKVLIVVTEISERVTIKTKTPSNNETNVISTTMVIDGCHSIYLIAISEHNYIKLFIKRQVLD